MSKIALSGDASGTGTFTIASPNSNSNFTLTLPASSGTMALTSAAGGMRDPIQPITASVASNALTVTLNPTTLDFRSSTLSSGTVNTRTVSTAISVTVSSGSTLGTINNVASRIVIIAIDNAGTVELAVVNIAGGNQLDETNLISTTAEGGAGAADSANVIYSTTARTSVPYRVVGFIDSTQTTAGTWASAPSTIQGVGGQALTAMSSVGYSQTWQSYIQAAVGTGRVSGTTYYNTTGRPIFVMTTVNTGSTGVHYATIVVNGITVSLLGQGSGGSTNTAALWTGTYMVPPGGSYSVTLSGASIVLYTWVELR
jgi:hypothetical protein